MSASKGLSITVRLSWGQHLPTHDIEPSSPSPLPHQSRAASRVGVTGYVALG